MYNSKYEISKDGIWNSKKSISDTESNSFSESDGSEDSDEEQNDLANQALDYFFLLSINIMAISFIKLNFIFFSNHLMMFC